MDVAEELGPQVFGAVLIDPGEAIAEEEALDGSESAERFPVAKLLGFLESIERQQHAAVVREVFAEAGLAVDGQAGQRLEGVELRDHRRCPLLKARRVLRRPPVC